MKVFNRIVLDPFCYKQFQKNSVGYIPYDREMFVKEANLAYQQEPLNDGYAPFCKHVFIKNFTGAFKSVIEITPQNQQLLKTVYEARTEKQLPVLRRFFPKEGVQSGVAKYLDLILYSKDQIQKQNEAMGNEDPNKSIDYDFGIVSVKPQDEGFETPMDPITMMRNALGKQEGGSGVALNKQNYLASVKFWSSHAVIR